MKHLEIEVKFYLLDADLMRRRIKGLGAERQGRVFETNIRFEDAKNNLARNKSLLRLRKDTKTTLTFKRDPPEKNNQYKVLEELEVEVSNYSAMKLMLEALGFYERQRYEKYRETFIFKDVTLCLDTMPYGDFIEIEGSKQRIRSLASQLGLRWEKRIIINYLSIFDIVKRQLDFTFTDVTFDNFEQVSVNMNQFLHLIEGGRSEYL